MHFQQFVWTHQDPSKWSKNRDFSGFCTGKPPNQFTNSNQKSRKKCRFWVEKGRKFSYWLKIYRNGQNKLTKRSMRNFSFLVKKSPLFGHFSLFVDFSRFSEKVDFGVFARSDPQPCSVRLSWKFIWELFRARQSPHAIFSSNGQHTAEDRTSQKRQNRLFQKSWKIGQKAKSGRKRRFWALMASLVCLNRFFSSFWPRTCIFSHFGSFSF